MTGMVIRAVPGLSGANRWQQVPFVRKKAEKLFGY